ncbi:MAG: magnesium transporter CorA [Methylococcales bacterium]|nr:magnesium transporter CorA [Methylococcales bacterium]
MSKEPFDKQDDSQQAVLDILLKHKLVSDLVHKQNMPRQDLIESLVRKENLVRLGQLLNQIQPADIAHIIDELSVEDQLLVWDHLNDARKESVLQAAPLSVLKLLETRGYQAEKNHVKAFYLEAGRLREVAITTRQNLLATKPIWIDLVDPSFEDRLWVGDIFGIKLPDPDKLNDLESSAKFYLEEKGEIHLHSDFLLDKDDVSNNVPVAFILYEETLFSIRSVDLPIFRLQRLRALTQPNYVLDARDMLLDLYAGSVEYSADALEDVYRRLEISGKQVLRKHISDEQAAEILTDIAYEEDLNGRIRRNVLDTRRAISFLMRSKILSKTQLDDSQQILRDIESLDGHTAFLFDKINFLMDATVGFININQNKVVKRLTRISVVFLPLNVLAGIGGMSEFSMMTQGIPWPVAYGFFTVGLAVVGWLTFAIIQFLENYEASQLGKK